MATPSGQIGLSDVNVENALPSTSVVTMNDAAVRTLAGPVFAFPQSTIGMNNLQGKTKPPTAWTGTISTPQANLDLLTWASANGYPGTGAAQVTVAPGVYVYADGATGATVYGMSIPAGFPGTVSVINNGFIMGQGGYGTVSAALIRTDGQPAINISKPVTITNNSYIAGGGGGSGSTPVSPQTWPGGAGGAGGGAGATTPATTPSPGGAGGAIGSAGGNGGPASSAGAAGSGGGGRILPGTGGTGANTGAGIVSPQVAATGGGAGGGGGAATRRLNVSTFSQTSFGGGGGWGAAAGISVVAIYAPGPGAIRIGGNGGAGGAAGNNGTIPNSPSTTSMPGGVGGKAINLNANTITWGATGVVYGSVA